MQLHSRQNARPSHLSPELANAVHRSVDYATRAYFRDTTRGSAWRRQVVAFFDGATWDQIRHWRMGRRRAPQWAIDKLRQAILDRRSELDRALAAIDSLAKEKSRD